MSARLPTELWVQALLRRVQSGGASGFVLNKGDTLRGDILVKVARLDGTARAFVPGFDLSGARCFKDISDQGLSADEPDIDAYIARALNRDPDLWVIEIEDRAGRHFLTEPIEAL